ncbi:acyl-CoA dehydrogenase [Streptomyces sp. NPDC055078]
MAIPITADGHELQSVARDFLDKNGVRAEGRELLDRDGGGVTPEPSPRFWGRLAPLGWLGVHLPEKHGGGGAGIAELVALTEEFGRSVAPGPYLPTVLASAVIASHGDEALNAARLPSLADGTVRGACGLGGTLSRSDRRVSGDAGAVLGGGQAELLLLRCGDDLVLVESAAPGVRVEVPANVDRGLRAARVRLDDVPIAEDGLLTGAVPMALALHRTLLAADAVGGARQCLDDAVAHAKVREQFGRTIGTFQAVKHHCADMLVETELATASVWDAARAATGDPRAFELAAAVAAVTANRAYAHNARLAIQVLGGIGFTWEHDAHLLLRRSIALEAMSEPGTAAADVVRLRSDGVRRDPRVTLPADVEACREDIRAAAREIAALPQERRAAALVERGYTMPHYPEPWGLAASPGLQMLIDEELAAAGLATPETGVTDWVMATLLQHGTEEQNDRWLPPALAGGTTWCQLFSEPGAGSDAAAVSTRATRVEKGWIVTGQKVWTTHARTAAFGLATVRTDPAAAKHAGLTMLAVDMNAPGVEVRPLRQITGGSTFNEVFLTDVFVPDEDVVGPVGEGWRVARATFGNERLTLGNGRTDDLRVEDELLALHERGGRPVDLVIRLGGLLARGQAARLLGLRRAERAVAGTEPGPEGNVTKLVRSQRLQEAADLQLAHLGAESALAAEGTEGAVAVQRVLDFRRTSIAGGTSEITRNQIAERILGLPRDPLIR